MTNFFIQKENSFDENLRLKQENENLLAQMQMLQSSSSKSQALSANYLTAKVFSTYPFNIKNQITVNIGTKQGVKKMMTATVGENILLGQVTEVFENYSIVQTIFDSSWQLPIRIGQSEVDGLFQGGNEPKVTLVSKDTLIQAGDVVYSSSREFPYGLKVGEVSEIKETSAGVFKEVVLKIPFNVSELREVNILK